MYGANPSSPSMCCLARSSGVGSNQKSAGYQSWLPSLEPPKPWMCKNAPHVALEGVPVSRRVLCPQHDADDQDNAMAWALQSTSYAAFKLTPLLSCSMYNTASTEHSSIIYCMLLWLSFFIFIPVRVRVPVATIQLHVSWRWWFLILFGVISRCDLQ